MSRFKRIMKLAVLAVLILSALCVPALALDESEVEAAVAASSKEAVTGNVLIWFLCAVAFLKVSQKINSFMASLGVNVGRTGGSMLADAMGTFRAVTMATGGAGRILGGGRRDSGASASGGASGGSSSSAGPAGFFKGGLIGMAARGDMRSTGSVTGDLAAQSLQSYMGHTALGASAAEKISCSQAEIGGGHITGREVTPEHPQGIEFAMYHVDQYSRPEGDYQKVFSADGAAWYKQHAVDTAVKTPFKAPDGEIDCQKESVKRLPTPPKRKDRM